MQTPYTYGPVMLSSLERCAFYLDKDIGLGRVDGRNDDTDAQRKTRRIIQGWLLDISSQIQNHCRREFLIQARTQYFDNLLPVQEFFPSAVPIVSITALEWDFLGTWLDASPSVIDSTIYQIGPTGGSFRLLYGGYGGANALRLNTYLGGMAYHGTQSVFTLEDVTGAGNITAARYACGTLSEAMGKVIAYNSTTKKITIDSLAGVFLEGEALTFQTALYSADIPATGATIASIDRQSLCEAYPDIARAIEIELRYMEKHTTDFENQTDGGSRAGASRRMPRGKDDQPPGLQEETETRLAPYVRYLVGT